MKKLILCASFLLNALLSTTAESQVAFSCDGPFIVGVTSSQPAPTLYQINTGSTPFTFTAIATSNNLSYNAIGYRITDNLIYGIEESGVGSSSANLIQVDANGVATNLGAVTGLPVDRYISGDFDTNGIFYVSTSDNSDIFVIDVDTQSVINQFSYTTNYRFSDLAFNPQDGMLYAVTTTNTIAPEVSGQLLRIDPSNGNLTEIGVGSNDNTGIGSLSADANGVLYGIDNLDVGVYQVNNTDGSRTFLSSSPGFGRADSAHCANAVFLGPTSTPAPVPAPTLNVFGLLIMILLFILTFFKTTRRPST